MSPNPVAGSLPPHRWRRLVAEGARYWANRLSGDSYENYQEMRYDRLWRADPRHFSHPDRTFQLDYCRARGLIAAHRLLDFGCGPLAAGKHFVSFLDAGNYVGADISAVALAHACDAVRAEGLDAKAPAFIHLPASGALGAMAGLGVDMIWAQSVLTHMSPAQVSDLLRVLPRVLRPGGSLLATVYLGDRTRQKSFKDWGYRFDDLDVLARRSAVRCELLDDFTHPRPFEPAGYRMRMLRFTPPW